MPEDTKLQFQPRGGVVTPAGFRAGTARAGIKSAGDDILLLVSDLPATPAAVFTRNAFKAAPVVVCSEHARRPSVRAIVTNSGNANCCTGAQGLAAARRTCQVVADKLDCRAEEVLVCSTGIIGHQLPLDKIEAALPMLELSSTPGDTVNLAAARAVMTTDTRPKHCAARAQIGGRWVSVGGQVKGVGMIGPDMGPIAPHATLLAFLTTDAQVPRDLLQGALEKVVAHTFNSVTVDGDTSTNDTCLLLANGASGASIEVDNLDEFQALLLTVCMALAQMVAADGEGATKLVTVSVSGAASEADARRVAMTVANSPLVKTAIFGRDPNWGRIAAAAGRSGVPVNPLGTTIRLNDLEVFRGGEPAPFEIAEAEAAMAGGELTIGIDLGVGSDVWTAWTCDFSYDYVKINAEYHT